MKNKFLFFSLLRNKYLLFRNLSKHDIQNYKQIFQRENVFFFENIKCFYVANNTEHKVSIKFYQLNF